MGRTRLRPLPVACPGLPDCDHFHHLGCVRSRRLKSVAGWQRGFAVGATAIAALALWRASVTKSVALLTFGALVLAVAGTGIETGPHSFVAGAFAVAVGGFSTFTFAFAVAFAFAVDGAGAVAGVVALSVALDTSYL